MVLTYRKRRGRAAFTLVELLVVIGLMGLLATISVAGYSAASRGMSLGSTSSGSGWTVKRTACRLRNLN